MSSSSQSPAEVTPAPPSGDLGSAFTRRNVRQLGHRECQVLEIVWADGTATVEQVSRRLPIRLAYTTVMTTLDRLFKKGLLTRVKCDRAFLYSSAMSPCDLENLRARALLDRFFYETASSPDVLLSCLVDVIGTYDDKLLHNLEEKVRAAKRSLVAPDSPARQEEK
jgi:predicted transcriptional regulator